MCRKCVGVRPEGAVDSPLHAGPWKNKLKNGDGDVVDDDHDGGDNGGWC